jgi:hypothetical protein
MTEERKPFWGKCSKCLHCWAIAYLPMELGKAAKLMKAASCPKCGEHKGITVAKQNDGKLLEAGA